ncbi:DUF2784 family protein [bacterium]
MIYKISANIIIIFHLFWILFMLAGFILTFYSILFARNKKFLDWWLFRTVHLCGITYVGFLISLREYCPLTILENILKEKYNPELKYTGSFIMNYIEKLVYPDFELARIIIIISTIFIAVFTLIIFIIRPPCKIKELKYVKSITNLWKKTG